jgi:phosphoglycolate phosphatase
MVKALIFDLDGTLIKLTLPLESMRSAAKEFYIQKGLPSDLLEPADGISSSTAKAKEYFLSNGMSKKEWDDMQEELDEIMSAYERSSAKDVTLIDGVLDTINEITSIGIRAAVLTNNSRHAMDIIMKYIPLEDYFEVIHTRHEAPTPKPYPDGLLNLIKILGLEPQDVIYVGDAMIDGVAASRAGIEFWGVSSGETPPEILREVGAQVVFSSISEIPSYLSKETIGQKLSFLE